VCACVCACALLPTYVRPGLHPAAHATVVGVAGCRRRARTGRARSTPRLLNRPPHGVDQGRRTRPRSPPHGAPDTRRRRPTPPGVGSAAHLSELSLGAARLRERRRARVERNVDLDESRHRRDARRAARPARPRSTDTTHLVHIRPDGRSGSHEHGARSLHGQSSPSRPCSAGATGSSRPLHADLLLGPTPRVLSRLASTRHTLSSRRETGGEPATGPSAEGHARKSPPTRLGPCPTSTRHPLSSRREGGGARDGAVGGGPRYHLMTA
jgi:hypothetical protein